MRNRLSILIMVALISLISVPQIIDAAPQTMDEVKAEKDKVNKKMRATENEIAAVLREMEEIYNELTNIEADIVRLEKEIEEKEAKITSFQEHFEKLSTEIGKLNETIEQRNEILKARLSSYQEQGGDINFLEVIFGAKSFNDFISRLNSINKITTADRDLIEQQEKDKALIVELQDEILDKITEQETMMAEVEEAYEKVTSQKASMKKKEQTLTKKQATLQSEKEKLQADNVALSKKETEIANYLKEAAKKKEATKAAKTNATNDKKSTNKSADTSKPTSNQSSKPSKSTGGKVQVGQKLKVESTAYGPNCKGCSGVTATGIKVNPYRGQKIIAVDPSVIPLGSIVYVPGYGNALAADTGGAIKGNRIDVLVKSENYAAKHWGRKHITVEIISLP